MVRKGQWGEREGGAGEGCGRPASASAPSTCIGLRSAAGLVDSTSRQVAAGGRAGKKQAAEQAGIWKAARELAAGRAGLPWSAARWLTTQNDSASGPAPAGLSPARTSSSATPRRVCRAGMGNPSCGRGKGSTEASRKVSLRAAPCAQGSRQSGRQGGNMPRLEEQRGEASRGRGMQGSEPLQVAPGQAPRRRTRTSAALPPPPTVPPPPPLPAFPYLRQRAQPLSPRVGQGLHFGRLPGQLRRRLAASWRQLVRHVLGAGHAVAVLQGSKEDARRLQVGPGCWGRGARGGRHARRQGGPARQKHAAAAQPLQQRAAGTSSPFQGVGSKASAA